MQARWAEWGYSWRALIESDSGALVGAASLQHLGEERANPQQIGWRLHPDHWGRGYAIEAAQRIVRHASCEVGAPLLLAVRDPANAASARIMDKLGMRQRPQLERWYGCDCVVHELRRLPAP